MNSYGFMGFRFKVYSIALLLFLGSMALEAKILKFEGTSATGLTVIPYQAMSKYTKKMGIDIQISSGKALVKSTFKVANGGLDMTTTVPIISDSFQKGTRMYRKNSAKAKKASKNLRSLFSYFGGVVHAVTWADSGIKSYQDVKGKKVFTGPPAGGANDTTTELIRESSGLIANKDYKAIRMNGNAALNAFQDKQFDVLMISMAVGSSGIDQLGLFNKLRLLDISKRPRSGGTWETVAKKKFQKVGVIEPNTYQGQVNKKAIRTTGYILIAIVNKKMSTDIAYKLTKAYWENLSEMKKNLKVMADMSETDPFVGMNVPLHKGAIKYFKEAGVKIPSRLK